MENYCVKNEMDKLWKDEDYIEIAEKQHERLSQKDVEYTEFICWILEQQTWDNDLIIVKGHAWDKFWESDIKDEQDMDMEIVESNNFYKQFEKLFGIDIFDEDNFVSMKYIDDGQNDMNLIVKDNGINQRYVIGV